MSDKMREAIEAERRAWIAVIDNGGVGSSDLAWAKVETEAALQALSALQAPVIEDEGPANMSREAVEAIRQTALDAIEAEKRNGTMMTAIDAEELLCLCDAVLATKAPASVEAVDEAAKEFRDRVTDTIMTAHLSKSPTAKE